MTTTRRIDPNPEMVALCFRALVNHLNGNSETLSNSLPNLTVGGMFVSWQSKDGELRGCLGTLSEVPLPRLLEFAITSSQNDDRFSPISLHEIHNISCTVSILHSFEMCAHSLDWEIGVHGIIVEFCVNGKRHRSTFLPNVMTDQRWSKHQALEEAILKTGCRAGRPQISVTRYKASKSSLNHFEYAEGNIVYNFFLRLDITLYNEFKDL